MKNPRFPLSSVKDIRQLTSDSGEMCQFTLIKTKNNSGRNRRVKVRRLRYTWQKKILPYSTGEEQVVLDDHKAESRFDDRADVLVSAHSAENGKEINSCDYVCGSYGIVSIMGRRKEMEDEVSVELGFMTKGRAKYDFFGVYDGHGGPQVARACRERFYRVVVEGFDHDGGSRGEIEWEKVMQRCFDKMDENIINGGDLTLRTVGSTVVVAVVGAEEVVVANCGDCRAVLARGGIAMALSNDHKPDNYDELKRIEDAGGRVINWNGFRVLGVLATSRSIGDEYLKPYVISKPEVRVTKRTESDEFMILGSDGLWDVVSNEAACQIVRRCLHRKDYLAGQTVNGTSPTSKAASVLVNLALARGSSDNISVIVVDLKRPTTVT